MIRETMGSVPEGTRMSLWRVRIGRLLAVVIPLALGGVLLVVSRKAKTPPQGAPTGSPVTRARVVTLAEMEVVPRVVGYGLAVPGRTFRAIARVEGEISWVADALEDGQVVSKGDPLLRIDDTDLKLDRARIDAEIAAIDVRGDTVRASLALEEADLVLARTELSRQQGLAAEGTVSRAEVDLAERQVFAARGKFQGLRNELSLAEAGREVLVVQRRQADRLLSFVDIAAPFDMRIGEVTVEIGQFVSRGQEMFAGDGIAIAEVPALFPIGRLRPLLIDAERGDDGGPMALDAVVRLRAPARVVEWTATVDRVGQIVDPRTQSGIVVVRVEGSYDQAAPGKRPPIRRNTFLEVELRARSRRALVVPAEAIRGGTIRVVDAEGRLEIRAARIAYRVGSVAVIATGARAGEQIVVSDLPAPVRGMAIEPVEDVKLKRRLIAEAAGKEPVK